MTRDARAASQSRAALLLCCAMKLGRLPLQPPPRQSVRAAAARSAAARSGAAAAFTRPVLTEVVIVEGVRDAEAVQQAVTAAVAITHGTPPASDPTRPYAVPPVALAALLAACAQRSAIVLADPDPGGRAMRSAVEAMLTQRGCATAVLHAFVPAAAARCRGGPRVGAVGVQYARPGAVRAALAAARPAHTDRAEFTRDDLLAWGLAGTHGAPPPAGYEATGGVAARRDAVGAALGFGGCDAKRFLRCANAYGFTRAQLEDAVATLNANS